MQFSRLKLLGFLLVVTTTAISSSAFAQTTFTVTTTDGSTYAGELVENVVGDHVTIKLADGQVRRFAAADIRAQNVASPFIVNLPQDMFPGMPGTPITYNGPDAVHVHVENDDNGGGTLFMESASGWVPACTMPCTTTLDPKVHYRLHGSDPFVFPQTGNLNLVADFSKRRAFRTAGVWMLTPGILAVLAGPLVMGIGAGVNAQDAMDPSSKQGSGQGAVEAGAVIAGAGVLLTVLGIVFLATNWSPTLATRSGDTIVSKRSSPIKLTPTGFTF